MSKNNYSHNFVKKRNKSVNENLDKKNWVPKNLGQKKCGSKKVLVQKIFWVQYDFGPKNSVNKENLKVNNLGPKIFSVLSPQTILGPK